MESVMILAAMWEIECCGTSCCLTFATGTWRLHDWGQLQRTMRMQAARIACRFPSCFMSIIPRDLARDWRKGMVSPSWLPKLVMEL